MNWVTKIFGGTSEGKRIPDWAEFDPTTMDETKKHALFMNNVKGGRGVCFSHSFSVSTKEFVNILAEFVNSHPGVEFEAIDGEEGGIIISGVDGLEDVIEREMPLAFIGIILDGDEMKKELLEVKNAEESNHNFHQTPPQHYM